jgi:hypothetical protein
MCDPGHIGSKEPLLANYARKNIYRETCRGTLGKTCWRDPNFRVRVDGGQLLLRNHDGGGGRQPPRPIAAVVVFPSLALISGRAGVRRLTRSPI